MDALYELHGEQVVATEYTRGPWDPTAQHGGAPAALLMRAFESCEPDPGLQITRVTYELVRPVPVGPLRVQANVSREGRRVRILEGTIANESGEVVMAAHAQQVRRAPVTALAPDPAGTPTNWAEVAESGFPGDGIRFPGDGIEIRYVEGAFLERGPGTAWFRLKVPVFAGEEPSPLQRLAAAADFPNGMATELGWDRYVFINPDLTLYIEREPVGEWVALRGAMRVHAGGGAVSQAALYDESGLLGRSLQSLYVAER